MEAFHSYWSLPSRVRNQGNIGFTDFELLTAILSALTWQQHSGPVRMVTDSCGAEFFHSVGLESLWDGMDTSLDAIGPEVDPFLFWAAGKLAALKRLPAPCVMLDTDLIVWHRPDLPADADIVAAHPEDLIEGIYPDPHHFHLKKGYIYPNEWDFSRKAANTAFLYLKDDGFKNRYVDEAIRFLQNVDSDGLNPVTAMCFAEQRILPMCADAAGMKMDYLMTLSQAGTQDLMTHVWGFKDTLRASWMVQHEFCMRCVRRIITDFPEKEALLANSSRLQAYWKEYKDTQKP